MAEKDEIPAGQGEDSNETTCNSAVSAVQDTAGSGTCVLSDAHRESLHARGISETYLKAHPDEFWSYTADTVLPDSFDWISGTPAAEGGGIVFTWPQFQGESLLQLRPDTPAVGKNGPVKYVGPRADESGAGVLRYGVFARSDTADAPVYVVEGTRQVRAAASALHGTDAVVIGIAGIQMLVAGLPPDLAASGVFRGRRVYLVADADAATNRAVYDGALATGTHIRTAGAKKVEYLQVPQVAGPNTGLDDYLATLDESVRADELAGLAAVALPKPAVAVPKAKQKAPAAAVSEGGSGQVLGVSADSLWDGNELRVEAAAAAILDYSPAARMLDGALAWYEGGSYRPARPGLDLRLNELVGELLGNTYTKSREGNITGRLHGLVTKMAQEIPEHPSEPIVNHRGGLLDLRTGENRPHTPEHLSIQQLAVEIDMDGECPFYDEWIVDRVGEEQALAIDALMADALDPSQLSARVAFFFGPSRSGKSTALRLAGAIFGKDQVSGVSLRDMEKSPYAAAELYGKSVNIAADLHSGDLSDISVFKTLTGGDAIFASKKFGAAFTFTSWASVFFSANQPPTVGGDPAYFARMLPIAFPKSYVGTEDPEVEKRLMAELPAIAGRWARAYGRRPKAHPAVVAEFHGQSDRVARFLTEVLVPCSVEVEPGVVLPPGSVGTAGAASMTQVHAAFTRWAESEGGAKMGRNTLVQRLESLGVQRIMLGAKGNKRALDVRTLDEDDWQASCTGVDGLKVVLWPAGTASASTPAPTPVPKPPVSAPSVSTVEQVTGLSSADLAQRLAAHFGNSAVLSADLFAGVIDAAVFGPSSDMAVSGPGGLLALSAPTVTLADLTAAGPLADAYWTRSVLASAAPVMSAAGIYVRERRLGVRGDLSSWDQRTTGRYVSRADQEVMRRRAKQAGSDAVTAKKAGDGVAAHAHREQADALSLSAAAARGLPSELTAYAVAIDPAVLLPALGIGAANAS